MNSAKTGRVERCTETGEELDLGRTGLGGNIESEDEKEGIGVDLVVTMFKRKTRLFEDNIPRDKTCPRSQIIKLVTFGTKWITKENTSLGPGIKFGLVPSQGKR